MRAFYYPIFVGRLLVSLSGFLLKLGTSLTPHYYWWLAVCLLMAAQTGLWYHRLTLPQDIAVQVESLSPKKTTPEIEYYRQLLLLQPTHRDVILNLAQTLEFEGDSTTAEKLRVQAQIIDPLYFSQ